MSYELKTKSKVFIFFFWLTAHGSWLTASVAEVSLTITRPTTGFTTNNQTLRIEGRVASTSPTQVVVSTNTPAGVEDVSKLNHSLRALEFDLGGSRELRGLIIRSPSAYEFPRGPRVVQVSFSGAGESESVRLNVSSGVDPVWQGTVVEFPTAISARLVKVEMLEGWQIGPIVVKSIEFLDATEQAIPGQIQGVSILVDPQSQATSRFSLEVLLAEGENLITLSAQSLEAANSGTTENIESRTLSLFYLPELFPEAAEDGQYVLSDGGQATLIVPADALDERIKRLEITALSPEQVDRLSYLRNTRIARGTAPVVAYRFEALRQSAFAAEATSALSNQPATLAVDGIFEPPSTWVAGLVPLPVRLTIDLGQVRTISRIVVHARVDGDVSFGPQRANLLVSNDNENFTTVHELTEFDDQVTSIELPTRPTARYFQLEITESKQVNNVQLNEVEFFDATDAKIISFEAFEQIRLEKPMLLTLTYTESDLVRANVTREEDLRIFAWDSLAREWQLVGGELDLNRRTIRMELNYITRLAVFQSVTEEIQVVWSFNPFSPDGNGVADVTRLTVQIPEDLQVGQAELVIELFNIRNQLVRTLINRTVMNTRSMSVEWDGTDHTGQVVSIGPYIYQIQLASQVRNGVIVVGK